MSDCSQRRKAWPGVLGALSITKIFYLTKTKTKAGRKTMKPANYLLYTPPIYLSLRDN